MLKTYFCYILLVLCGVATELIEIKCPSYCNCDIFENLRRAVCRSKKLYSIEIDIPPQAEIIDLSDNQISELGKNIFLEIGLTNLKLLNVSHNKISQIHLNGFEGLTNLKTLDLSFNMLRYFSEQWFVSLAFLQELYLRGNNLKSINQEPRLKFEYLKVLDISHCAIESLSVEVFQQIPKLEVLDVSENYLISIKVGVVHGLPKINTVRIKGNNLKCTDPDFEIFRTYTADNNIQIDDPCLKTNKKSKDKMQRMMLGEPQLPKKNSWLFDENHEKTVVTEIIKTCEDENKRNETTNNFDKFIMKVVSLSPMWFTIITFIFGISVGILLGCFCQITNGPRVKSDNDFDLAFSPPPTYRRSLHRQNRFGSRILQMQNSAPSSFRIRTKSTGSKIVLPPDRNLLLLNEVNLSDSTPVLARRTCL